MTDSLQTYSLNLTAHNDSLSISVSFKGDKHDKLFKFNRLFFSKEDLFKSYSSLSCLSV